MPVFTQAMYDTLLAAYVNGAKKVKYADKEVEYHSLEDMERLLARIDAQLNPVSGRTFRQKGAVTGGFFPK